MVQFGAWHVCSVGKNKEGRQSLVALLLSVAVCVCGSVRLDDGARFQLVLGATVRALGGAVRIEFEEHARVRRPVRHVRIGAVCRQVFAVELYWLAGLNLAHVILRCGCCKYVYRMVLGYQTSVSQC